MKLIAGNPRAAPGHEANPEWFKIIFQHLRDSDPELSMSGEMMLALIEYIETDVDFPPKWANTSPPGELLFYSEEEPAVILEVSAYPRAMNQILAYEIKYALQPPWDFAVGYTSDVKEAARMILDGCQRAYQQGFPLPPRRKIRGRST